MAASDHTRGDERIRHLEREAAAGDAEAAASLEVERGRRQRARIVEVLEVRPSEVTDHAGAVDAEVRVQLRVVPDEATCPACEGTGYDLGGEECPRCEGAEEVDYEDLTIAERIAACDAASVDLETDVTLLPREDGRVGLTVWGPDIVTWAGNDLAEALLRLPESERDLIEGELTQAVTDAARRAGLPVDRESARDWVWEEDADG